MGRQEGCRDGDGMVGREDQGERRKGRQAGEEKDWAGGGRAQGTKNLEEGTGGRESGHDRVVAGMASGLPRTTRDPKAAGGGKKSRCRRQEFTLGCGQLSLSSVP